MAITLALKYRPKTFEDVTEQKSVMAILKNQIKTKTHKNCYLFTGSAGTGKAQPMYSKILTPNGFITMGEIKVGDTVFTHSGKLAQVSEIFPQGKRPIYEITLQDGAKIRVADNHLNCVYRYNQSKKCRESFVWETTELIKQFKKQKGYKLRIDIPSVDFEKQKVFINPYLLGALIGDGSLSNNNFGFSNMEDDIIDKVNSILKDDYGMYLKREYEDKYDYAIRYITNPNHCANRGDKGIHDLWRNYDVMETLAGQLNHYGLNCKSVDKHIPKEYLFNDRETRIQLLHGLYDTDGCKEGRCYSTSSKQLSEDFTFLARSLGIRVTVKEEIATYNGKQYGTHYRLHLKSPKNLKVFSSKKHEKYCLPQQQEPIRNIVSIDYIGEEECQCIMVNHEDHTYISDDFVPTHNTTTARIFANELNGNKGNPIEIDGASNNGVDQVRDIINQSKMKSLDSEYKIFIIDETHALSNSAWQAMLKLIEEPPKGTIFIFCTTDPQKIPATILSRVQRYDFKKISLRGVINRLTYILEQEGITDYELPAIQFIAKTADGGMRDAITLMDKALSYNAHLTTENVLEALGCADYTTMLELLSCFPSNLQSAITLIENVYNDGLDLTQFMKQFFLFVLDVAKYQLFGNLTYTQLPENIKQDIDSMKLERELPKVLLNRLLELNNNLKRETNVKQYIEATLYDWFRG